VLTVKQTSKQQKDYIMTNFERIKEWSDERLITQNIPDRNGFVSMIVEELGEFLEAKTDDGRVDAMADIIVFAYGEIAKYGYHGDKVMEEVIKEISSRTGAYDPTTKKWQKDKSPEAQAKWYTADFTNCKL
jgi:predicted HAD superfamily Cof-like phosphohydrolase